MTNIDRRAFFRRLGLGVVAVGPVGGFAGLLQASPQESSIDVIDDVIGTIAEAPIDATRALDLLSPLGPGSTLATSTLIAIKTHDGHVSLDLETAGGDRFRLEVFGRDSSIDAARPVTRTARYDVFVANGGRGDKQTARAHGLAAYALAELISRNEPKIGMLRLRTLRSRS